MNRVLCAFGNVNDKFIAEALEYQKPHVNPKMIRWMIAVPCTFILLIGVGVFLHNRLDPILPPDKPAIAYGVGNELTSSYGVCQYVSCTETSVSFRIKSNSDRMYPFHIDVHKKNDYIKYVAAVGGYADSSAAEVFTDMLSVYIDGKEASTIFIPADGNMHDVVIDFSALLNSGYELEHYCELFGFATFFIEYGIDSK